MSLILNVEILGEFRKLTSATTGAQGELKTLNAKAAAISSSIHKSFAGIGVGLSFAWIARELNDAAKAARDDAVSMSALDTALKNTTKATKDLLPEAEELISKLSRQHGVADDDLRPAFVTLYNATTDLTESNKLLAIALDVSAGTGRGLDTVALALAKSVAGSDTALIKLLPSVKDLDDPIKFLGEKFKGTSEAAAKLDPYRNMTVVFGEMQEQVGMRLLPELTKLSIWLSTPEGQSKLKDLTDAVIGLTDVFVAMVGWALQNKDAIFALGVVILGANVAAKAITVSTTLYNAAAAIAAGVSATYATAMGGVAAGATAANTAVSALVTTLRIFAGLAAVGMVLQLGGSAPLPGTVPSTQKTPTPTTTPPPIGTVAPGNNGLPGFSTQTGNNVTVNVTTPVTSSTIIKTVQSFQKATGTTLAQALK
jgi:hypothetical protein